MGQITSGLEGWCKEIGKREPPLPYQSNNRVRLLGNIYLEVTQQIELSIGNRGQFQVVDVPH